jgi:DNA-directed RNA polymerase specialized sigma24 family protein
VLSCPPTTRPEPGCEPAVSRRACRLARRFGSELSQDDIAARIGVSPMHVSRLLARSLATLRGGLNDDRLTPAERAGG